MGIPEDVNRWIEDNAKESANVGRYVRLSCQRHLYDLESAGDRGFYFDSDLAEERIAKWPERYFHSRGKYRGKPFELSPSQQFIIWSYYGWLRSGTAEADYSGTRRFRHMLISCARKWGKTAMAASIALDLTLYPTRPDAEAQCIFAATKLEQAYVASNQAMEYVSMNPYLAENARVFRRGSNCSELLFESYPWHRSTLKPICVKPISGLDISTCIFDEIHELKEQSREFLSTLETSQHSRLQPSFIVITTAGSDASTIWDEYDSYHCKVLHGHKQAVDDTYFSFIARLDEAMQTSQGETPADDIYDESKWIRANPDIERNGYDFVREQSKRAKLDPAAERDFKRYYCNMRVRSEFKAIEIDDWRKLAGELSPAFGEDRFTYVGFDIGTRDDLASIGLCWWNQDEDIYEIRQVSFCPQKGKLDLSTHPWHEFVKRGELIATDLPSVTDLNRLVDWIKDYSEEYGIFEVAADRNNARTILTDLEQSGFEVFEFPQTASVYTEPIREFLRLVRMGKIRHNGDKLLEFSADNLVLKPNIANEVKPDKELSPHKIDPIVAVLMAFARAISETEQATHDYYEENHLEVM